MPITNLKKGSILLNKGIDVSKPAEYLDDSSLRNSINFEVKRNVTSKRNGETELGGIVSRGTLTLTGNAGNTQTVVIGAKTYTFQTVLTNVDGNVLIGDDASGSIDNLIAAINLAAGSGTTYAAATTAHPNKILATTGAGDTMDIEVTDAVVATTETLGSGEWGAATTAYASGLEIMTGRLFDREGTKYNVRVGLDKIEYYNSISDIWVDITGTDLTGATTDLHCTAIPLLSGERILCITNGIDAIRKWTGVGDTAALGGTPPVAKFIQEYKTYLVCANIAGGTDRPERVQWSDTADPETWTGGNSGTVDLVEDGKDITGLNVFGDYLSVHKETSIYLGYLVSSSNIFQFVRKSTGAGTIANNSIVNLPTGEQIFLASDGLRIFNGISAPLIDSPINDEIRDELSSEYDYKAWGVLVKEKDEVWIGIPLSGSTCGDTIYKFNYVNRTLYKDTRKNATVAWLGTASSSKTWDDFADGETWDNNTSRWNERYLSDESVQVNIGKTDGTVNIVNENAKTDNGESITAYLETKDFQVSQDTIGRWKKMELWAKGNSVSVFYSTDAGNTWYDISGSPLTLDVEYPNFDSPDILYFDVVASKIRFKFLNDNSNESLTIKQFIIEYTERENRR